MQVLLHNLDLYKNPKGFIMKILSQEIAMQSEHSFSRVELETILSFSTVCLETQAQKEQQNQDIQEVELPKRFGSFRDDGMKTLYEMIQAFISRLMQRHSQEDTPQTMQLSPIQQSQADVYHHTSLSMKYQEEEQLTFSTKGCIKTDKGTLDIDMNFSMKRGFIVQNNIDIYSLFDPLVVNLDSDIPSLSQKSFSFDLDNDGKSDQISTLGTNSGFLALDKNHDGKINQGSELFGTMTGDGFGELSKYDDDLNGWIDENDKIFDKLQIWLKNEDSPKKELVGLGEVGIGAIFLDAQQSEFSFKTQTNQTLGVMKNCGMFLKEDGTCGNISQIDFATRNSDISSTKDTKNMQHKEVLSDLLMSL